MKISHGVAAAAGVAVPALAVFAPATAHAAPVLDVPTFPSAGDAVKSVADRVLPPPPSLPEPVAVEGFTLPHNLLRKDGSDDPSAVMEPTVAPEVKSNITIEDINTAATNTKITNLVDKVASGDIAGALGDLNLGSLSGAPTGDAPALGDFGNLRGLLDGTLPGPADPSTMIPAMPTNGTSTRTAVPQEVQRLASWMNSAVDDPLGTITATLAAAGGPALLLDANAPAKILEVIAGPMAAGDLGLVMSSLVLPMLTKDLPLAIAAGLGTLFGVPLLSGLAGAVLGASISGLAASALALVVLATVLFGAWLLAVGLVFLISIPIALVIGAIVFFVTIAAGLFINPAAYVIGAGAAIATIIFIPILLTGAFAILTVAIPVILFALLAPPLVIGAGLLGSIPGAIIGGLLGYLAGLVAAVPLAALVFTLVGLWAGKKRLDDNPDAQDALERLKNLFAEAWNNSELGRFINELQRMYWESPIGRIHDLWNRFWGHLWASIDLDAIIDGAKKGGLRGIIDGFLTGFPAGALTTALWTLPLLLVGLAATLLPPLALAVAATLAAGIGLWMIPFLLAAPLWILGILFVGATLFIGALGILAAIAGVALIVVAFVASPVLGPFAIALGAIGGLLLFLGLMVTGAMWLVGGFVAGIGMAVALAFFALLLLSILAAAIFVGIPTFLLTAPLFIFPALSMIGLWLLAILAGGSLAGIVGAIYGAGSGGWKGALAGLLRSLDVEGAFGVIRDGIPDVLASFGGPNFGFNFQPPTPPNYENPAMGFFDAPSTNGPQDIQVVRPLASREAVPTILSPTFGTMWESDADRSLTRIG